MSLVARVPEIDWDVGFERHWNAGDPVDTHAFNALSFLFPQGESFFIAVAKEVAAGVPGLGETPLGKEVAGFVAQESVHSCEHAAYNAVLRSQGFSNVVHDYVAALQAHARRRLSPLSRLAVVCAYEHYTAVLGNFILCNPQVLARAQPDMALVWGWHAAEETEHKAVCFDLYRAAGGRWPRRVFWFLLVSLNFQLVFGRLYASMLYRDGCLRRWRLPRTLASGLRFFFGARGVGWHLLWYGLHYLGPGFHPWQQDNRAELDGWLARNRDSLRVY